MRQRTIRAVLAASLLAATSAFFVGSGAGPASAAATPTLLTDQQRHPLAGYHADRMIVDGTRHRLLVADDVAHRILAVTYDGTVAAEAALPDGADATDLRLSADAGTLWAILPGAGLIVSWNAATLEETGRHPVGGYDLGHLTLAAGRVWFTYAKNYFAALDPGTGEVTRHVLGDGNDTSASAAQPLITANPTDPARLAITDAGTRGELYIYDIGGATPALVARTRTQLVSGHRALEYTADGSMLYVGGANGVYYNWPELEPTSARTITADHAVDVEAVAGGWIAAGFPPDAGRTDIRIFPAAEVAPVREFDIPVAAGAATLTGIAWEPDGSRLLAITTDPLGAQSLWTIEKPTVVPPVPAPPATATAITLTAPATATRDSGINVRGTLTGNVPMGAALKTTRVDAENPAGVTLPTTNTNAAGGFSVLDFPKAGGTVTYTVAYAGDATHKPSSAKVSVAVTKTTPALSLNGNGSVNAYGATVTLTAKLGATYRNRTVEIWADPYGGDQPRRLLKKAAVSSSGTLSTTIKLTRTTTAGAVFTGDTRYAARTVTATLNTRVAASTAVGKHYRVSGSYHHVRRTVNPTFTTTMTPYPGRKQQLVLERYSGGKWVAWKSGWYKLSTTGKHTWTLTGTHTTGVKYRVRAGYVTGRSGDSVNHTTYGAWKYFTFTR